MENINELDQILKNTEFENLQQLKYIESEREKIEAYEKKINECELNISKLEAETATRDEQTLNLSRQHAMNRDNIDSLKHTSIVLVDHEEALKKKLQHKIEEVELERIQQMSALTKYSGIWAGYKGYYDTMERVQEVKQKRGELQALNEQNTSMQASIEELEGTLKAVLAKNDEDISLTPWILRMATLRVETNKNVSQICKDEVLVMSMKTKIQNLQEKAAKLQLELEATRDNTLSFQDSIEDMPHSSVEPVEEAVQPMLAKHYKTFPPSDLHTLDSSAQRRKASTPSIQRHRLEMPRLEMPVFSRRIRTVKHATESSSLTRATESSSLKHATESSSLRRATESSSLKHATESSSLTRATESSSLKRATESSSLKHATESSSLKRATESSSLKRATELSSLKHATESRSLRSTPVVNIRPEMQSHEASKQSPSLSMPQLSKSHETGVPLQPPPCPPCVSGMGKHKPSPLHVAFTQPTPSIDRDLQQQIGHAQQSDQETQESLSPSPPNSDADFQFKVPTKTIRQMKVSSSANIKSVCQIRPTGQKVVGLSGKSNGESCSDHSGALSIDTSDNMEIEPALSSQSSGETAGSLPVGTGDSAEMGLVDRSDRDVPRFSGGLNPAAVECPEEQHDLQVEVEGQQQQCGDEQVNAEYLQQQEMQYEQQQQQQQQQRQQSEVSIQQQEMQYEQQQQQQGQQSEVSIQQQEMQYEQQQQQQQQGQQSEVSIQQQEMQYEQQQQQQQQGQQSEVSIQQQEMQYEQQQQQGQQSEVSTQQDEQPSQQFWQNDSGLQQFWQEQQQQQQYGQFPEVQSNMQPPVDHNNVLFDANKGFNFGSFEQDSQTGGGSNMFAGGFGLFGGGTQVNSGDSSFGAGFSFGGSSPQDQSSASNTSTGFSLNFGSSTDKTPTSGSNFMFNF